MGFALSWAGSHSYKAAPFMEGLPERGPVSTSALSPRRFSQRLIVASDTPKTSTTSLRGMPRSMADRTLRLKYFEYAFMSQALYEARYLHNPL